MMIWGGAVGEAEQPTSGGLWAWGEGGSGCLGDGTTVSKSSPIQIGSLTNWVLACTNQQCSFAVRSDGKAFVWGDGFSGKTGLGNTTDYSSPVQLGALTDWAPKGLFACGGGQDYWLYVKSNGTLWAWGRNNGGKLGLGDTTTRSSPVQIGALTTWRQVGNSGSSTSSGITTSGTLWTWGYGTYGQLGHSNTTTYKSPVQVGGLTTWAHHNQGSSSFNGITTDGKIWTCGRATHGVPGHGSTTFYSSPRQVGALTTWAHPISATNWMGAIKTDGTLWTWGLGSNGKTAQGNTTTYSSPVQVTTPSVTWKYGCGGQYGGRGESSTGELYTWGFGGSGQIGNGVAANVSVPVQLGTEKWLSLGYCIIMQDTHYFGIK